MLCIALNVSLLVILKNIEIVIWPELKLNFYECRVLLSLTIVYIILGSDNIL